MYIPLQRFYNEIKHSHLRFRMRIHSSSLNFSPINFSQKLGKNNSAQNKDSSGSSVEKDAQNKKINQPYSPEEIKKTQDSTGLTIDSSNQNNIIKPTDSQTLKALSAYSQTFNVPYTEQRAQLVAGIDVYA